MDAISRVRADRSQEHLEILIQAEIVHKYSAPSLCGLRQQLSNAHRAYRFIPYHDPRMNRVRLAKSDENVVEVHSLFIVSLSNSLSDVDRTADRRGNWVEEDVDGNRPEIPLLGCDGFERRNEWKMTVLKQPD